MKNYSLGNRIRNLRFKHNLSQEQLALRADITTAYLGQIERDEKNPTVKLIEKIANALNMSLSELFSDQKFDNECTDEILNDIIFELSYLSIEEKQEVLQIIRHILKFKLV